MGKRGPKRTEKTELLVAYLRNQEKMTFEEIGSHFGFSKQRAHSIYRRWEKESYARMNDWRRRE